MAKVKRKQIEYEGTDKQVIKGNGELGDYNDSFVVQISIGEVKLLSYITSEDIVCNRTPKEIITAILENRPILWFFSAPSTSRVSGNTIYPLNVTNIKNSIQIRPPRDNPKTYTRYYCVLYYTDASNEKQITINCTIKYSTDEVENESIFVWYYTDLHTINKEYPITEPTRNLLGDTNLYDGFYFPNAVRDNDGNWYGAVVLGEQVWLGENLRTKSYSNGTIIEEGDSSTENPAYQDKSSSSIPLEKRGLYYNLYAILNGSDFSNSNPSNIQGPSPVGFHIPSLAEFDELCNYISTQRRYQKKGFGYVCSLKSLASIDYWIEWTPHNYAVAPGDKPKLNNTTGFSLVPTGLLNTGEGSGCYLWTSTAGTEENTGAYVYGVDTKSEQTVIKFIVTQDSCESYNTFLPVRCVSDLNPVQFRNWYIQQYGSLQHHLPEEVQVQSDWDQTDNTAPDFIKNKPTIGAPLFYGYTNSTESTSTKVVTLAEPTTGFKNGSYIMVYFAGGGVPAGNDNAISIGTDVYYLAYKAQGITQAGVINQGDKVLLWCHNGFAHIISNDRWSLPTITAADEGKILKVVNGALALVNP